MTNTNFDLWINTLRTTTLPQTSESLGDSINGYCCLGLGCAIAGVDFDATDGLPGREFYDWLGVEIDQHSDTGVWDLLADWTPNAGRKNLQNVTASSLNDNWGLTFAQIADVFDYFGIRTAVEG